MSAGIARRRARVALGLGVLSAGLVGSMAIILRPAGASDNLSCPQGTTEIKVDTNPLSGLNVGGSASFTVAGQTFTFTKVTGPDPFDDDTFDFTSTIAVSDVLVKGGAGTNSYLFDPAATSGSGLHPPLNGGGQPPTISHVSFCAGGEDPTSSSSSSTSTSSTSTSSSTSSTSSSTSTSSTSTSSTTSTSMPTVPTTPIGDLGSTASTSTPTTVHADATLAPTTTTFTSSSPGTNLPFTGSTDTLAEVLFALSCIVGGALTAFRRRRTAGQA